MVITVGSLFSGIGGIDLGLERAGMEIVWQVEIDPFCIEVLEKHWPTVKKYKDVFELEGDELEKVDLICGGFPCQPVSCAGKKRGEKDKRWLWSQFYRIICRVKPKWVLVENVKGLLNAKDASERKGGLFGGILRDLAYGGYSCEWTVLSASAVGAPHRRERVFLVAYSICCGGIAQVFSEKVIGENFKGSTSRITRSSDGKGDTCDPGEKCQEDACYSGVRELRGRSLKDQLEIKRGMDIFAHGIPKILDGHLNYWSDEWEKKTPRVVRKGDDLHVRKLRALGNAVVPECAQFVGECIIDADDQLFGTILPRSREDQANNS
ncbi:MAG: DNA (cytosine-5-)-methyltransferase [Methanothrix sp.]